MTEDVADFWSACLVLVVVIALAFGAVKDCRAETDHQRTVQDLAHFGAGVMVASAVNVALSPMRKEAPKWFVPAAMIGVTFLVNAAYEGITDKPSEIAWERNAAAVLGATCLILQVSF